jgi:hypothetical protein
LIRGFHRRLERLEKRVLRAGDSFSLTIRFVSPTKGVTRTLLLEAGEQVWTEPDGATHLKPIARPFAAGP